MSVQVALLRGINVGGKNILPMQDLREILGDLGCESVKTYIQSGNVVFESKRKSDGLARRISGAIEKGFHFAPSVLVMSAEKFERIADANPYAAEAAELKHVHTLFLAGAADDPDMKRMHERKTSTEEFTLTDEALYFHAPDGIARSKLASEMERHLGVSATGRNQRTVEKLQAMLAEML
ncbi:MAG: DUF1697 domain-containing protein [Woeseiaceae bacterium]|nr:DUF1697 domain-containing protein [Woeseiaceae bacterium]